MKDRSLEIWTAVAVALCLLCLWHIGTNLDKERNRKDSVMFDYGYRTGLIEGLREGIIRTKTEAQLPVSDEPVEKKNFLRSR